MIPPPARIGTLIDEVETPALLIDLDAYERNLDRMAASVAAFPVRLRPHAKTHKCPIIAQHQVARGAVGVCCQTLGEAEAMVLGGVRNILITNQVVSPGKIRRLVALVKQAEVMVCVDDVANVLQLDAAARSIGVRLPVLVEVDIGQHRCGVEPGVPTFELARQVADRPGLRFAGLHAYHGIAQHVYGLSARVELMEHALGALDETVALLLSRGLVCGLVTGGGTGTYPIEAASGVYTEVQPGSYIFMDADYRRVEGAPALFESALFVLTTVLSRTGSRAVCDAGLKASSIDSGLPQVKDRPEIRYVGASDEHGTLEDGSGSVRVGDPLWLIPGHCDPTVNLYDWYVGIRDDRVEALWPISARGANA
ncbi:MAG: dhaa [Planctomycetota bacterium]|nr:dhaa [Planctomycetota bacterium]